MRKITLTLALALSLPLFAQRSLAPSASIAISKAEKISKGEAAKAGEIVSAYITFSPENLDRRRLQALGVVFTPLTRSVATARVPLGALPLLAEVDGVEYIECDAPARQMLDKARAETGAAQVLAGAGLPGALTGKGVVVGIVDSGFDYTHEAFRDGSGQLRIARVWEQATEPTAAAASPELFGYGTEFTSAEEIMAAGGDIRNNSHGTHVTSIAAGSPPAAALSGMAPEAEIVLVSMTEAGASNVNISNAIAYIFNYAQQQGKACVVNLSLGSHSGPHDGSSTFDAIADELQGPGRLIIGAAGNSGAEKFHIHQDISADAVGQSLRTFLEFPSGLSTTNTGHELELWASPEAELDIALIAYKLSDLSEAARVEIPLDGSATLSLGRNISGTLVSAAELSPLNGKRHLLLRSEVTAIRSGYAIALEITPRNACSFDLWPDHTVVNFSSRGLEGFIAPTGEESTICEIGGTAKRILSVGAYTTRADYQIYGNPTPQHLNETVGDRCSFSGFGPTADGRTKPEVCAPGAFISAAVSQHDASGTIVLSDYTLGDDRNYSYGFMQGTSMATPMVTGIVATWLEANPTLSPEELKEIVAQTSRSDAFTGSLPAEGSNFWGFGKIDALAGAKQCLALSGIADRSLPLDSTAEVRVYTPSGILVATSLTAPLPHGTYIVSISNGQRTWTRKFVVK